MSAKLFGGLFGLVVLSLCFAAGCGSGGAGTAPTASIGADQSGSAADSGQNADSKMVSYESARQPRVRSAAELYPEVIIKTSLGDIRVKLFAEQAPETVWNFRENYVARKAYDGTLIHHVESGYMIVAGGFNTELQPIPARAAIRLEANNGLSNRRGTLAMIRDPETRDSGTSQFFINLGDNSRLDYQEAEDGTVSGYCVFGEVVSGMDVVEQIAQSEVAQSGDFAALPTTPVVILAVERVE